ncbi:MAG: hypothetical protein JNM83_02955 [Myxococcales bacterium]|nr:hypothetical protein [Myxococcales bacterium]
MSQESDLPGVSESFRTQVTARLTTLSQELQRLLSRLDELSRSCQRVEQDWRTEELPKLELLSLLPEQADLVRKAAAGIEALHKDIEALHKDNEALQLSIQSQLGQQNTALGPLQSATTKILESAAVWTTSNETNHRETRQIVVALQQAVAPVMPLITQLAGEVRGGRDDLKPLIKDVTHIKCLTDEAIPKIEAAVVNALPMQIGQIEASMAKLPTEISEAARSIANMKEEMIRAVQSSLVQVERNGFDQQQKIIDKLPENLKASLKAAGVEFGLEGSKGSVQMTLKHLGMGLWFLLPFVLAAAGFWLLLMINKEWNGKILDREENKNSALVRTEQEHRDRLIEERSRAAKLQAEVEYLKARECKPAPPVSPKPLPSRPQSRGPVVGSGALSVSGTLVITPSASPPSTPAMPTRDILPPRSAGTTR